MQIKRVRYVVELFIVINIIRVHDMHTPRRHTYSRIIDTSIHTDRRLVAELHAEAAYVTCT